MLKLRAKLVEKIHDFFRQRNILAVETPILYSSTATDPYIKSFSVQYHNKSFYLQTSPELPMKRLLCAGSGDIYQLCKVFRDDEMGARHNPEFTLLEWYRLGFDHYQLMAEVDELLQLILQTKPADKISYQQLFIEHLSIDPLLATTAQLQTCAQQHALQFPSQIDRDDLLNLLLTHVIEPKLGEERPVMLYNYPASQAALAKINPSDPPVAERFEVFYRGMELANGYHELTDAKEQSQRFIQDNERRQVLGLPTVPLDEALLNAMAKQGLPDCAGVALGVDRLIMLAANAQHITKVFSIDIELTSS